MFHVKHFLFAFSVYYGILQSLDSAKKMEKELKLSNIASIGRTFDEYFRLFAMDDIVPESERILDAAAGASSFCAEANSKGYNVIASDKIYNLPPQQIEQKCCDDLDIILKQLPKVADLYVWKYFKDIKELGKQRKSAFKVFLEDFRKYGEKRYIPVKYPATPFYDKQFTISLSGGFLFLYDKFLSYDFHKKTITELSRITSKEIRIWPIVNMKGERSDFISKIKNDFGHFKIVVKKVDYEFFKNATEMLILRKPE